MPNETKPILRLNTEQVRVEMKRRGIPTFEALAEHIGVSRATITRAMTGKNPPSNRFVAALSTHLGVPVHWLVYQGEEVEIETGMEVVA